MKFSHMVSTIFAIVVRQRFPSQNYECAAVLDISGHNIQPHIYYFLYLDLFHNFVRFLMMKKDIEIDLLQTPNREINYVLFIVHIHFMIYCLYIVIEQFR